MTKTKGTKKALLLSVISLFACFAMLLGTTFAWFTDSVTSANNIITSGELNVEMYWADGTQAIPADDNGWTDASTGAIFDYDLWEPGYVEVRHIKIANVGTLALKYKVQIVANGEVSELADVIDVYYLDPAAQIANRTDLTDAYKIGTLTDVLAGLDISGNGTLLKGESDTITIALKMQETAGNEYQNLSIGTDFSIQLLATQYTYESDSFGTDYDASATMPDVGSAYVEDNSIATTIEAGDVSVTIPAGALAGKYEVVVTNKNASTDANGQTTYTADINLLKDGVKVERNGNTTYVVKIQLEADKSILKVLHKGNEITDYTYNAETGVLEFETDSFSPFAVIYEENKTVKVTTAEEFINALTVAQPGVIIDATALTSTVAECATSTAGGRNTIKICPGITIKGLVLDFNASNDNFLTYNSIESDTIVFEDCTFTSPDFSTKFYLQSGADTSNIKVIFNNCTFMGPAVVADNLGGGIEFNNCTFNLKDTFGYIQCMGGNNTFNSCTFNYTGAHNGFFNTPQTKHGYLNMRSEGYSTVVTLNQCTGVPSVFKYAVSGGTNSFTNNP